MHYSMRIRINLVVLVPLIGEANLEEIRIFARQFFMVKNDMFVTLKGLNRKMFPPFLPVGSYIEEQGCLKVCIQQGE